MASQGAASGSSDQPPLGDRINTATRGRHLKLNQDILRHLPDALPPYASDPSAYVTGLLHIAPIYQTFESLWQEILDAHPPDPRHSPAASATTSHEPDTTPSASNTNHPGIQPPPSSRIPNLLRTLHLPALLRTAPLLRDIRTITGWSTRTTLAQLAAISSAPSFSASSSSPSPSAPSASPPTGAEPDTLLLHHQPHQKQQHQQQQQHYQQQALPAFLHHIRRTVAARPHALLAYAWVLYMALFAGGREIRAALEGAAGEGFWGALPVSASSAGALLVSGGRGAGNEDWDDDEDKQEQDKAGAGKGEEGEQAAALPLAFFRFETPLDGEDLRAEFKRRFEEAGRALTPAERDEVVAEARHVFDGVASVVEQLAGLCKAASRASTPARVRGQEVAPWLFLLAFVIGLASGIGLGLVWGDAVSLRLA